MGVNFEELDYQRTVMGDLILRRRLALEADGREIFEVKLNDEYLMSSLFHEGEVALADLSLAGLSGEGWDISRIIPHPLLRKGRGTLPRRRVAGSLFGETPADSLTLPPPNTRMVGNRTGDP